MKYELLNQFCDEAFKFMQNQITYRKVEPLLIIEENDLPEKGGEIYRSQVFFSLNKEYADFGYENYMDAFGLSATHKVLMKIYSALMAYQVDKFRFIGAYLDDSIISFKESELLLIKPANNPVQIIEASNIQILLPDALGRHEIYPLHFGHLYQIATEYWI